MERNKSLEIKKYDLLKKAFSKYVYFDEGFDDAKKKKVSNIVRGYLSSKNPAYEDPAYKYNLCIPQ